MLINCAVVYREVRRTKSAAAEAAALRSSGGIS
jgi:hypothetical protein